MSTPNEKPSSHANQLASSLMQPPVIAALIARHAEDAAFYWSQRASNAFSPRLDFDRLAHFDRLLDAHLDGLRVADRQTSNTEGRLGDGGWRYAFKNVARWKTAGEAFVAYVLALEAGAAGDVSRLQALWPLLEKHADTMLSGAVSALGWIEEETARPWLEHWITRGDFPLLQEAALRAYAIRRQTPQVPLDAYLASPHAPVRTAACVLVGRLRLHANANANVLYKLRKDKDLAVRRAALVALYYLGAIAKDSTVLADLWKTLRESNKAASVLGGLAKQRAVDEALRLICTLGHATPCGHAALIPALKTLQPRQAITVLAHHGDSSAVPTLIVFMGNKSYAEHARLAAWALTMITGVDWDKEQLTLSPPVPKDDQDERTTPLSDPDVGLPWPNLPAVQAWWAANAARFTQGTPYLLGQAASDSNALLDVLHSGTQVQRWAAATRLSALRPDAPLFETRASAVEQGAALEML
jgi:uncharacterized protein (TIGR02270 family)